MTSYQCIKIVRSRSRGRCCLGAPYADRYVSKYMNTQWNQLSDIFSCTCEDESIPECAADNICIAWPSIKKCIKNGFENRARPKVLDFGCGGGLFCKELYRMGFDVTGYDPSEELAKAAQFNTPPEVTVTDSATIAAQNGKYNIITSIMVLQFIDDIESTISNILSLLEPGGLVVYAVFNPSFIEANLIDSIFTGFDKSQMGYMELKKGVKIKCYSRTELEMRSVFDKFGYEEIYLDYPEFTEDFLRKYKLPFSIKHSEYLIQAFRKKSSS